MPLDRRSNVLARRSKMLVREMERRGDRLARLISEPEPFGQVKLDEATALRRYLKARESGELLAMRQSMGGAFPDKDMDRWSLQMQRLEAKYLPGQVAREFLEELRGPDEDDPSGLSDLFGPGTNPFEAEEPDPFGPEAAAAAIQQLDQTPRDPYAAGGVPGYTEGVPTGTPPPEE